MFVRTKQKQNGKTAVQIVASHRKATKVTQYIVRHIGQAATQHELQELKTLAQSILQELKHRNQPALPLLEPQDIHPKLPAKQGHLQKSPALHHLREEQRIIEGITDVFGSLYDQLGFHQLIRASRNNASWNRILRQCVMARLANPVSKRRTAALLEQDFGVRLPLDRIYRLMDHVARCEKSIKKQVALTTQNLFKQHIDVLFFDVTTLFFESIQADELRQFGFSKDCKFKETQVVLALISTTEGLPLTYQLFPGNTCEGKTLVKMVESLRKDYEVKNAVLVADRAMFTQENLSTMDELGVNYIVAAKLKTLSNTLKEQILHTPYRATVVKDELHWVKEFEHNKRRLIVSYSSKRAEKDAYDRQRLIDRLMKKSSDGKVKIKDLIPNYGSKKYVKIQEGKACINEEKMEQDAQWDGLHGVISNCTDKSPEELLGRYRDLWQIEAAFRLNKHDLKMRPIYHWNPDRIRAHIVICFLTYAVAKQATYRLSVQHQAMSFEQLRNELLHCQASVLCDITTQKRYRLPSKATKNQQKIYQIFGLKRSEVPTPIQ